jgi:cyclophilin family peptidyl-prolyl cis-trans isomerase
MAESVKVELRTSAGDIIVELDPVRAPKTTENFLGYVRDGFPAPASRTRPTTV